ncbi:Proteasome assembly chaperone 3 [Choanephora cucurbitarum]|uniref:Proteasome assembly chaperone 3 n=1 Tax=Choanephora cucurbitarum TaxID=101091 RepID=A0A1C7NSH7_9FUNG|nr:Proteasome assembly chaperone 3 [Choanephora cucurbitarum]
MSSQDFPLQNKQTAIEIDGVHTEILLTSFADKIFIVITQYGKIGSLIQTTFDIAPHLASNPSSAPASCQFLMGESSGEQSELYVLYSTSILQAIGAMNPHEKRPLLLGIALRPSKEMALKKQTFHKIIDQIMANAVW